LVLLAEPEELYAPLLDII